MTKHCGNPECNACNYQEKYPDDPYMNLTLIYASIMRATVGAMAEALQLCSLHQLLEGGSSDETDEAFNKVFQERMASVLPSYADDVIALVSALTHLLPSGVYARSQEVLTSFFEQVGAKKIAEGEMTQEQLDNALSRSAGFVKELEYIGEQYLTGDVADTLVAGAAHSAPRSVQ